MPAQKNNNSLLNALLIAGAGYLIYNRLFKKPDEAQAPGAGAEYYNQAPQVQDQQITAEQEVSSPGATATSNYTAAQSQIAVEDLNDDIAQAEASMSADSSRLSIAPETYLALREAVDNI